MKRIIFLWLLILCPISSYANQCRINPFIGGSEEIFISCKVEAEQGNAQAQYNLALIYDQGDGVEQNKLLANEYFKQSCEQGFEKACNKLKE